MNEASVLAPASGWIDEEGVHVLPMRVYYEDTDAGGIVYHATYLRFMERARTEMLRVMGVSHRDLTSGSALGFAVRRCTIDYLKPARLDDALEVRTRLQSVRGASLDAVQVVRRAGEDLARALVGLAWLDGAGRPRRLPGHLRAALNKSVEGREA